MSEQELTQDQLDRQDFVDDTIFQLILDLAANVEVVASGQLGYDIEFIGIIREAVQEVIVDRLQLMTEMEFYPYEELDGIPGEPIMEIKCIVAGLAADGTPDFFFVKVKCTTTQYDNGEHYEAAKKAAEAEGYEPRLAYDENDYGGQAIVEHFEWNTASVVSILSKPDAAPDPQHKIFVVVSGGVVNQVYGPKGADYVIIDEDERECGDEAEATVAFRHEELDAAVEAGEVEEL